MPLNLKGLADRECLACQHDAVLPATLSDCVPGIAFQPLRFLCCLNFDAMRRSWPPDVKLTHDAAASRSEDEMEKPSRGNGQTSAKISGIVHVASAEEATKFVYIRGDKPASIARQINRSRSAPPVGKACKCYRQSEGGNDKKRPDQRMPHERRRALNETSRAAENTKRYSHPPRCQKANFGRAKAVREICVEQTELDKFELCKIFVRNRIADLIVYDAE